MDKFASPFPRPGSGDRSGMSMDGKVRLSEPLASRPMWSQEMTDERVTCDRSDGGAPNTGSEDPAKTTTQNEDGGEGEKSSETAPARLAARPTEDNIEIGGVGGGERVVAPGCRFPRPLDTDAPAARHGATVDAARARRHLRCAHAREDDLRDL